MKKFYTLFACSVFSFGAIAQSIDQPSFKSGDIWQYKTTVEKGTSGWSQTHDEITVDRATPTSIYYTLKQNGSTQAPLSLISGVDWSRVRDVNGRETVVNKPLNFPLVEGKTWEIQYTEQHPNKAHIYEKLDSKYTVVGAEEVTVPAGKFKAVKIEVEGQWVAQLEPSHSAVQAAQVTPVGTTMVSQTQKTGADTMTGRTYKAFWYVPEVKRWVKSVEEYYNKGGVRTERFTGELESYKLGD